MAVGRVLPPWQYRDVIGRIHFNDDQLSDYSMAGIQHYRSTGAGAVALVEEMLALAGRIFDDVGSCLDLGCGYGRVLRVLQTRIDPSKITACDVNVEAVRFCASEFRVKPLASDTDLRKVAFETYDLIWIGSLLTHMSEAYMRTLFEVLKGQLLPGGLLVFTTQGEECLDLTPYGDYDGALQQQVRDSYATTGMAFLPYGYHTDANIGLAWHSPNYVRTQVTEIPGPSMKLLKFSPRGWDRHQDVFAYQRRQV